MSEAPKLVAARLRDAGDEWHIECRMSDGQKGAFIRVDIEFEELAELITEALVSAAMIEARK